MVFVADVEGFKGCRTKLAIGCKALKLQSRIRRRGIFFSGTGGLRLE